MPDTTGMVTTVKSWGPWLERRRPDLWLFIYGGRKVVGKNADGQYVGSLDTVWSLPFNVDSVISFIVERSE